MTQKYLRAVVEGLTKELLGGSVQVPIVAAESSASIKLTHAHVFEALDLCIEVWKLVRA